MASACVLLANGFEEIEAITIIDVLRRAGVRVTTAGQGGASATGAHGVAIGCDAALDGVRAQTFDAIVLPGGMPGATNLRDDDRVIELVRSHHGAGKVVAAICAAPIALGRAGVLQGKRATCYPGFEDGLVGAEVHRQAVVQAGNVVTSRGPATAMAFALALAAKLTDQANADAVAKGMLVAA